MVIWTPRARTDLKAIHDYIAQDSPLTAKRIIRELIQKTDSLLVSPYLGKKVPEFEQQELRKSACILRESFTKLSLIKPMLSQWFINAAISKIRTYR